MICRGVVNRDMKPENLLLKRKHTCQDARCTMENLRCVDFGSAAALEDGEAPADSVMSVTNALPLSTCLSIVSAVASWLSGVHEGRVS